MPATAEGLIPAPCVPGDRVLALYGRRGGERSWRPGVVRSISSTSARVDFGAGVGRVPFSRLRVIAG
jgi:hypothetical protein